MYSACMYSIHRYCTTAAVVGLYCTLYIQAVCVGYRYRYRYRYRCRYGYRYRCRHRYRYLPLLSDF